MSFELAKSFSSNIRKVNTNTFAMQMEEIQKIL